MSKKRPTESSWDSDEELLSDTSGISAFPKASELDLLAEDGELDEEALLGLDDSAAAFNNDSMQPIVNRQRSKNMVSSQQSHEPLANQAFVFEVAETGDLEEELAVNEMGNEMVDTYNEGMNSYSNEHELYHQNGSGDTSQGMADVYHGDMHSGSEVYKDSEANYNEGEDQTGHAYPEEQSVHFSGMAADDGGHNEDPANVELGYDQADEQSVQVHLEYEVDQQNSSGQLDTEQAKGQEEQTYESDSESDEDSRHSRGKFTSERTGVISLSATTEREAIPDTLEINEEQANQIKEFMSDKSQRGRGRGGRSNRGRQSAHSRLGNRPGTGPQPSRGGMFNAQRMSMMNQRFQAPSSPRGPGMPRALMNQRILFGGMRQQMPQRSPVMGELFNPVLLRARSLEQSGGRFPAGPLGPQGPLSMMGPNVLLEPMKQLLQRMRGPHPGSPRISGHGAIQRPGGQIGMRMGGPDPRAFVGSPRSLVPNRMVRPLMSPTQGGALLMRPMGSQLSPLQQNPFRQAQPMRGRLPPHQRLGQRGRGITRPSSAPDQRPSLGNNRIFINPLFQGKQVGPSGLTRTVKMGAPVQQKKAKALIEKAKQIQIKQTNTTAMPVKRKSTGGDDPSAKVVKKEVDKEESTRVVEKQEPIVEDPKKISSLLEEQKRKREMIQKRKELARQKQAEEKRKELEQKIKTEGKKIESIVGGGSVSDQRTVEKSGDSGPIKVVSRSIASRLGPPPASAQKIQMQVRGPPPQAIRGPQQTQQQMQGSQSQQIRGSQLRFRALPPQQIRTPQPQVGGNQPQLLRGPSQPMSTQFQQVRGIQQNIGGQVKQQQIRGLAPQQIRGPQPQQIRGPPLQQIRAAQQLQGPPPQSIGGLQIQQSRPPTPHQLRGPPPQQMRGQAPQQIGGQQLQKQLRGPPPQLIRGTQQQIAGGVAHSAPNLGSPHLRGPAPQHIIGSPNSRPIAPSQVNPIQSQGPQRMGAPPPSRNQFHARPPPSSVGYQAPPPAAAVADPRFGSPQFQPQQQQTHASYNVGAPPPSTFYQGGVNIQPGTQAQPPHFANPPAQQHYSNPPYPPNSSDPAVQNYNYPEQVAPQQPVPGYQQGYPPPQQEYQQQTSTVYSAPYLTASNTQQATRPSMNDYQNSQMEAQAYSSSHYDGQQVSAYQPPVASAYQSSTQAQQHYVPHQQTQASFPPSQETSYQPSTDYYSSAQPIQTIQTISNQTASSSAPSEHNSPVGQKIQTIGQRIQPVTGTQMRSIIHNVASPPQSSAPARSVQHRAPTLHISRAVMEGNVPVLPGSQKVIILNVPQMATRETLIRLCRHFGHVEGVNLMREQNKAVVQFQKGEQAAKCVSR
ncbi:LOW QUALITY PROTEIN: hypothetical protein PoB_003989900, partial [Plakobranchus ocellatus]